MKYFAVFISMKSEALSKQHRPEHLAFLETQRNAGNILINGRFTDGSGGLVIYRGEDESKIESLVNEDPYIKLGARNYEIREWDMESNYEF
ncbi:YciI family protein [Jeotgalicoccus sp. ATCC 8456]|uniref:YciI family protein n=1 Tax=Jeotgalicoccus sp. ATCC 8456 TaxID=946435 RepID=UPI0018E5D0D2|nr:YciI family protein [Jeotgalicoccus sp. ATCC 8456]QQD84798.1 hypothetical protein JEM45_09310 [Jeotgalicoccus sp. ATCC 8456]